jgi:hypothetical protein
VGNPGGTLETVVRGLLAGVGTPGPYALEVACPLGSVMVGNHVDACNKIEKIILKENSNKKSKYNFFFQKSVSIRLVMQKCKIKPEFQISF